MAPGGDSGLPQDELLWVEISEPSFRDKANAKGWSLYLVPLGCAVTVGVLAKGLYNLYRKDSSKQQLFMRYRVLAQGITVAVAMFALFDVRNQGKGKN